MAKPEWRPSEEELQRALVDLGRHIAYPDARDLASRVRSRLQSGDGATRPDSRAGIGRRFGWPLRGRRLAVAVLILALAVAGVVVLASGARATVSRWLGLPGVVFVNHPAIPMPTPGPVGMHLLLGERVTLAAATQGTSFRLLLPAMAAFRTPDEVYLQHGPPGQVALVYRAWPGLPRAGGTGVGLLLTEFVGDLGPEHDFFFKGITPGTRLEHVTVHGEPGYWLSGSPHLFFYAGPDGMIQAETVRLAGNTLLWQHGRLTLRLEAAMGKDEALRIAASVR